MKIAAPIVSAFIAGTMSASAFVAPHKAPVTAFSKGTSFGSATNDKLTSSPLKNMADDLDIPCEDDCALENYPKLPESVHPGVNTGQAMVDLLLHAKENGE